MKTITDLSGQKFNMLTVTSFNRKEKNTYFWNCKCDCGKDKTIRGSNLKSGATKSCGCLKFLNPKKVKNLTNLKFDHWTVIDGPKVIELSVSKQGKTHWFCRCKCGKEKWVYQNSLTSGKSKSCGCEIKNKKPHGMAALRHLYSSYKNNANQKEYEFLLTEDEFAELTKQNCFYCGSIPNKIYHNNRMNGDYIYNGIDRVNNNKGYIITNVVTSCTNCNLAKRNLTQDKFFNMVKMIYERHLSAK